MYLEEVCPRASRLLVQCIQATLLLKAQEACPAIHSILANILNLAWAHHLRNGSEGRDQVTSLRIVLLLLR